MRCISSDFLTQDFSLSDEWTIFNQLIRTSARLSITASTAVMGLDLIFSNDDGGARDTYARLAERHVHRDRLKPHELEKFWDCVAFAAQTFLSPAMWETVAAAWSRILEHAMRRFNKYCRDSLFKGPTYLRSIVGDGVVCTQTREELDAPWVDMDRRADEYGSSEQFPQDRGAIADSWKRLVGEAVDFGTIVMRR